MKILIDTDVLIDVALNRESFAEYSSKILDKTENGLLDGFIAWHSISNFYYLISKLSGQKKTKNFISELLEFVSISATDTKSAVYALSLDIKDFEDSLQISAAKVCNADFIVTRNIKHYRKSPTPAISPKKLLERLNKNNLN